MSRKCNKITFGRVNHYIFLILIGAIFHAVLTFIESNSTNFADQNKHPIVYTIIYSLGLCLNFILLIILKIRNKSAKKLYIEKEKVKDKSSINTLPLDKHGQKSFSRNFFANRHIKSITKKEKYLWILMISIIDYITYSLCNIFG